MNDPNVPRPVPQMAPRSRGLGDTVAGVIDAITLRQARKLRGCGCAKRQEWLNRVFPYRRGGEHGTG